MLIQYSRTACRLTVTELPDRVTDIVFLYGITKQAKLTLIVIMVKFKSDTKMSCKI